MPVRLIASAGAGLKVEGLDAPLLHQRADVLASDFNPVQA